MGSRALQICFWEGPLGTPAGNSETMEAEIKSFESEQKCRGSRPWGEHRGEVGIVCGEWGKCLLKGREEKKLGRKMGPVHRGL